MEAPPGSAPEPRDVRYVVRTRRGLPKKTLAAFLVLALLAFGLSEGIRYWAKDAFWVILSINFLILLAYFAAIAWIEKPLIKRLLARKGRE